MHSVAPLVDPTLWVRWLLAAALLLWLPGHLIVARWLRPLDPVSRGVTGIAAGLLLVPLVGWVFALSRVPLTPWSYVPAVIALAWAAHRSPAHRGAVERWCPPMGLHPRWMAGAIAAWCGLAATLLLLGHGALAAPPHVHDASNHAWFTLRVLQTHSLLPERVLTDALGHPGCSYFMGWHAAAALLASVSGVAPYVSAWLLAATSVVLVPAALVGLWRTWGIPSGWAALAALLVAVNLHVPSGVLGWGGFGQVTAILLTPCAVLAGAAALRSPSRWGGALWGALAAALVQIHASDALVAVVLSIASLRRADWLGGPTVALTPALSRTRADGRPPAAGLRRARWAAVLAAAAVLAIGVGLPAVRAASDYAEMIAERGPTPQLPLGHALERFLATGGSPGALKYLALPGIVLALAGRGPRRLALLSLGFAALYLGIASVGDPLSRWLTIPFYQEAARVRYLQVYLLAPLMVLALAGAAGLAGKLGAARLPAWTRRAAGALAIATLVVPAARAVVRDDRNMASSVPFGPEEYALARRIAEVVPPGDLIANFYDDGSSWAMHVSGRRFTHPMAWPLWDPAGGSARQWVFGLVRQPWGADAERLRALGARWVYVSDWQWPSPGTLGIGRADFDADPRFVPILRGGRAALYRIEWEAPAAVDGRQ